MAAAAIASSLSPTARELLVMVQFVGRSVDLADTQDRQLAQGKGTRVGLQHGVGHGQEAQAHAV
ncbi:hypothetical protein [Nocardia salmonicida]|uniref:hypothetical protein n=1 Tax=Nocardia salmonicida TaxID=53431 RepID=UPI001041EE4F|nr:hypothetical protein [Nocardia salmonicida]